MDSNAYTLTYAIVGLLVSAGLALIPANIASKKGHSFGKWWLYGFFLFFIAFIHSLFIEDYNAPKVQGNVNVSQSVPEEIKKYKELLDSGVITQAEFDAKKEQLLNLM